MVQWRSLARAGTLLAAMLLGQAPELAGAAHPAGPAPPAPAAKAVLEILEGDAAALPAAEVLRRTDDDGTLARVSPADRARLLGTRSLAHAAAGDYKAAELDARAALAARPDDPVAHMLHVEALLALGRTADADAEASAGARQRPADRRASLALGVVRLSQGRVDACVHAADSAIRADPSAPDGFLLRAAARRARHDWEPCFQDLARALALNPHYGVAPESMYEQAGDALVALGRPAQAVGYFRAAAGLKPGWIAPRYGAWRAYYALERFAAAGALAEGIIADFPKAPEGYIAAATCAVVRRDYDTAAKKAGMALQLAPNDGHALQLLGYIAMAQGHAGEALGFLERSLKAAPGNPAALATKAVLLATAPSASIAQRAAGLRLAERAAQASRSQRGLLALAVCQAAAGNFDLAVRTAQAGLAAAKGHPGHEAMWREVIRRASRGRIPTFSPQPAPAGQGPG